MIACWHEEKNVDGVFDFLISEGIAFDVGESHMKGHTAFLVELGRRKFVANKIAAKFGRFHLEHREIEVTPEEQKIVDAKNAHLLELTRIREEKKARLQELFNGVDEDEDEEIEEETETGEKA